MTVLSFGGGQDSTAILYLLINDIDFYLRYVRGHLIVVMSDTGDEHKETYEHIEQVRSYCAEHSVPFYFLTASDGYHPRTWPSLIEFMQTNDAIMSKAYPKSCTDNLKIKPIYNFLDTYIAKEIYGVDSHHSESKKSFIKRYATQHGKIRVLIGIAAREESRLGQDPPAKWMRDSIERVYPLVNEGFDRAECQRIIRGYGKTVPLPSNCRRCPFMNDVELLWLYRFYPNDYYVWVNMEARKIRKWEGIAARNLGVNGDKLLPEILERAIAKHGHMTDEELHEYKMSHGHCVKSKY